MSALLALVACLLQAMVISGWFWGVKELEYLGPLSIMPIVVFIGSEVVSSLLNDSARQRPLEASLREGWARGLPFSLVFVSIFLGRRVSIAGLPEIALTFAGIFLHAVLMLHLLSWIEGQDSVPTAQLKKLVTALVIPAMCWAPIALVLIFWEYLG